MSTLQSQVRELYAKVQAQKAEIANAEKGQFVTDCQFRYGNSSQVHDIRTIRHTNQLQEILAFLLGKRRDFDDAGKILGIQNEFTWFGATLDQWTADIKVRAAQLEIVRKRADLLEAETKLMSVASAVDAGFLAELELENVKTLLK